MQAQKHALGGQLVINEIQTVGGPRIVPITEKSYALSKNNPLTDFFQASHRPLTGLARINKKNTFSSDVITVCFSFHWAFVHAQMLD